MRNPPRRRFLLLAVASLTFGGLTSARAQQPAPAPSSEPTTPSARPVMAARAGESPSVPPVPVPPVDVLYGALILATRSDDPKPAELPAPLRPMAKQLGVFGYNQFQVLGEKQAAVPTGTEDWLVPSRQFFLRVDTRTRLPEGDGYQLGLQLFQHDRPLPTVNARLRRDRPLFIRGPMVGEGQLIILLRVN